MKLRDPWLIAGLISLLYMVLHYCVIYPEYLTRKPAYSPPSNFHDLIQIGMKRASGMNIALGGLVRDAEDSIEIVYKLLKETGSRFQNHRIFFYEHDSVDNTIPLLMGIAAADSNIVFVSEKLNMKPAVEEGVRSAGRFEKMARFRNRLLDAVRAEEQKIPQSIDHKPFHFDLYLFVDTDLPYGWEVDGLMTSLAYEPFDVMCAHGATQDNQMYDTLAFRNDEFFDTRIKSQLMSAYKAYDWDKATSPLPVRSCFGGLAIYNASSVGKCRYAGVSDCEHVELHECMAEAGHTRVFINPLMVFYYGIFIWRELPFFIAWLLSTIMILFTSYYRAKHGNLSIFPPPSSVGGIALTPLDRDEVVDESGGSHSHDK